MTRSQVSRNAGSAGFLQIGSHIMALLVSIYRDCIFLISTSTTLHYVYLERINNALEFTLQYNHHPVRTEHNLSPIQLFHEGAVRYGTSHTGAQAILDGSVPEDYGVVKEGPIPLQANTASVVIDPPRVNVTDFQMQQLMARVNPSMDDGEYGIQSYLTTLDFLFMNVPV